MWFGFRKPLLLAMVLWACSACSGSRPTDLGVTAGTLRPCPPSPNCVSSFADDPEHRVAPYAFQETPAELMTRLRKLLGTQDRVRLVTAGDLYLHAEFTSRVFRFVDDVEFLIDPEKRLLHFRSASRIGYSDLGANRDRIESIKAELAQHKPV